MRIASRRPAGPAMSKLSFCATGMDYPRCASCVRTSNHRSIFGRLKRAPVHLFGRIEAPEAPELNGTRFAPFQQTLISLEGALELVITRRPSGTGPGRWIGTSMVLFGALAASCGGGSEGLHARWGTAERISPASASGDATAPSVAMDPRGNATAIWHQEPEGTVWAARQRTNGPWEPPTLLDTQTATFFSSKFARAVAMDAAGDAVAVWGRFDGSVW